MLFVENYTKDFNGRRSAIAAGYSEKTAASQASRLLTDVNIKALVAAAKAKQLEEVNIDAAYVLRQAVKLHERCMQEIPVMEKDKNGKSICTGEYKFDATGANKALETIGKHIDILAFDNTFKHIGDKDNPINININDTERAARIAQILQTAVNAKGK